MCVAVLVPVFSGMVPISKRLFLQVLWLAQIRRLRRTPYFKRRFIQCSTLDSLNLYFYPHTGFNLSDGQKCAAQSTRPASITIESLYLLLVYHFLVSMKSTGAVTQSQSCKC